MAGTLQCRKEYPAMNDVMNQTQTGSQTDINPVPTALKLYRQYETYQAALEVYPEGGLRVEACFGKVVLHLIKWLKRRVAGSEEGQKEALLKLADLYDQEGFRFLAMCPDPEEMGTEPPSFEDLSFTVPMELQVLSVPEEKGWVMRLAEPDNGAEGKQPGNRIFVTETAVYQKEKTVSLSVRTICREPSDAAEDAAVFRPAFIKSMILDKQLLLAEEGLDRRYAFTRKPVTVQISKGRKTDDFVRYFLDNKNRQKPVIFCTEDTYSGIDARGHAIMSAGSAGPDTVADVDLQKAILGEICVSDMSFAKKSIDTLAARTAGYGYVVVLEGNTENLFSRRDGCLSSTFSEHLYYGNLLLYLGHASKQDAQELMECILDRDQDTAEPELFKERLDQAAGRVMNDSLRRSYDYHAHAFFYEARTKRLERRISGGVKDPETFRQMEEALRAVQEEADGYRKDNAGLSSRLESVESRNQELNKALSGRDREISSLQKRLDQEQEKTGQLRSRAEQLQEQNAQIKQARRVDAAVLRPMLEIAFSYHIEEKEEVLRWIREQFSDTLIVHPRAERMFFDCTRRIDRKIFCKMIFLLSRYTAVRNENKGTSMTEEAVMEQIKLCDIGYNGIANENVGGVEYYPPDMRRQYELDITAYDSSRPSKQLMQQHVKFQVDPESLIRIYYLYDETIGKSIIGAMPEHLKNKKTAKR